MNESTPLADLIREQYRLLDSEQTIGISPGMLAQAVYDSIDPKRIALRYPVELGLGL